VWGPVAFQGQAPLRAVFTGELGMVAPVPGQVVQHASMRDNGDAALLARQQEPPRGPRPRHDVLGCRGVDAGFLVPAGCHEAEVDGLVAELALQLCEWRPRVARQVADFLQPGQRDDF